LFEVNKEIVEDPQTKKLIDRWRSLKRLRTDRQTDTRNLIKSDQFLKTYMLVDALDKYVLKLGLHARET
jgi:hypothetical protein